MFKSGSIENEIMKSMEKHLISNKLENQFGFNKISRALDYLNAAANIFDKCGFAKEAQEITSLLKDTSWKDAINGGLADNKNPKDFNPKSLEKGMKVEMEHTNDPKIAIEIAMDHLTEDPNYYEKLELIEGK